MQPGQNHRVVLANQVGGTVVADAIKLTAAGSSTPRTATWSLPVTTTGTYNVYVRWTADATNATNATYTVHYAGGTTVVPMNQTTNGGQWNLLGTFTLNPALNPLVELSDQANGRVVADAVMVVPSGVSTDHVTYTPTLTTSGTVDIYAKWTESATRAQAVTYTVQHAGGSTDILVNQQQPSAGWFRLGAFSMAPGQNHHVEVSGALEGVTVADAVRFVSAGVSAPGITYVHTDHLGSPQKMTDATKAIIWDAVYTPFGQVHSITGTATNNQRFPGQYADQETGYNYNYFRDYDPTTGRYVQSDPIGLWGGLNSYGYVLQNPFKWIDPFGLAIGDYPPPPPGYNPGTWQTGQWDDGNWVLTDPAGNSWTIHPEDAGHWRHWDKQDPNGKKEGREPSNSKKRKPNQKKKTQKDQCETDPSEDAPPWEPSMGFQEFRFNIPPLSPAPGGIPGLAGFPPIRVPWPNLYSIN